jgi:hypothetical protein
MLHYFSASAAGMHCNGANCIESRAIPDFAAVTATQYAVILRATNPPGFQSMRKTAF